MTKDFVERLFERTVFVFLSGIILLLLGATGGIVVGTFSLQIPDSFWRIGLSIVGILLIGFGIFLQLREPSTNLNANEIISSSISNVLTDWNQKEFVKRLNTAIDVRMIAVANYDLIHDISEELRAFLLRGGHLRCIYVKPSGHAIKMVAMRSIGVENEVSHLKKQYESTIEVLQNLSKSIPNKENIKVKEIDYLNSAVLTLIDPLLDSGIVYLTVNGFGKHYSDRPCIVIPKSKNEKWFKFFTETFDNTWASSESSDVTL